MQEQSRRSVLLIDVSDKPIEKHTKSVRNANVIVEGLSIPCCLFALSHKYFRFNCICFFLEGIILAKYVSFERESLTVKLNLLPRLIVTKVLHIYGIYCIRGIESKNQLTHIEKTLIFPILYDCYY